VPVTGVLSSDPESQVPGVLKSASEDKRLSDGRPRPAERHDAARRLAGVHAESHTPLKLTGVFGRSRRPESALYNQRVHRLTSGAETYPAGRYLDLPPTARTSTRWL